MKMLSKQIYFSIIPFLGLLVLSYFHFDLHSENFNGNCSIDDLVLRYISGCENNNTVTTFADDTFTINVEICYASRPTVGTFDFSNTYIVGGTYSVDVSTLPLADTCVEVWNIPMMATEDVEDIYLTASFSAEPSCSLTKYIGETREQCSLCDTNESQSSYPSCWPSQTVTGVCDESESFAPDIDYPEHTPIRYIKTVLHVFQQEDPDSLGQWKIHPTNPWNFTKADTNFFRSWFSSSGGANDFLQNLCDDTTDFSPHIRDARLQLLNYGIEGVDLFFHPDNQGWGMGSVHCGGGNTGYASTARTKYVTSPSSSNPYYDVLKEDSTEKAFHIFITGGVWVDQPPGDPAIPDDNDCYWLCGGGFTTGMLSCGNSSTSYPYSVLQGTYQVWLSGQGQGTDGTDSGENCSEDYMNSGSDAGMGKGLLGEIFHVLTVDHTSPLQAHVDHDNYYDSCEDTPATSLYNWMDCYQDTRCALTQCQVGRIHRFFEERKPAFERFPDGQGGFTRTLPCESTLEDIVIPNGADITWAGPRTLRSSIIIESGGKLTIKCDVGMPTDASIKVEGGGRLYIDGGSVFNNCENEFWRGITVEGTNSPQFPLSSNGQGLLYVKPGSIIENAANIDIDEGALLYAQGADFINCGSLTFMDYDKFSFSRLLGCTLTRDASFTHFGYWPTQLALLNINRLLVSNCRFETYKPATESNNGVAIHGFSSNFQVENSYISNYHEGIKGSPWPSNPPGTFFIRQCTLANNEIGIASHGCNNIEVQDNTFDKIGDYATTDRHIGLLLEDCTGFEIHGNHFYGGNSNPANRYGIIANDTGAEGNLIERNKFKDLYAANQAEATNNDPLQVFAGLQYLCNENESGNSFDFLIKDAGIAGAQGAANLAAGNTFSYFNSTDGDYKNVSAGGIDYFYFDGAGQKPDNYSNITPIQTTFENTCMDDDHDYPIDLHELEVLLGYLSEIKADYRTLLNLYLSLLNGGYTEPTLINLINNTNAGGANGLQQQLLAASPYLTEEALKAFALRDDIFTAQQISTVLAANPDVLREPSLQAWLYAQFTSTYVDGLLQHQGQQSARTDMEAELAAYLSGFHRSANQLIKHELSDTLGLDYTVYRSWLLEKDSPAAAYERANSYLMQGNTSRAIEVRDSIPLLYPLTAAQTQEHVYYEDLSDIAIAAIQNGTHYTEFPTATVEALEVIANGSEGRSGVMARQILNLFYGYNYEFMPQLLTQNETLHAPVPHFPKPEQATKYQPLSLIPNPAKDRVTIHYSFREEGEMATLMIYDLHGRLVEQLTLAGKSGSTELEVASLERGIYYCTIERAGSEYPTTKLVLTD
jgi:hypothetical protein